MVNNGVPFREAYKIIGKDIEEGNYIPNRSLNHTLEGSIGNLCNNEIENMMNTVINGFDFDKVDDAFDSLLHWNEKE